MLNIGPQELILILIVALVVVGPHRLPELGRSIGKALREFRKIQDDVKDTIKFDLRDEPERPYVRPRQTPSASPPEENGEVTASGAPPADTPDTAGSVLPEGNGQLGIDESPGAEVDPEPRAAE